MTAAQVRSPVDSRSSCKARSTKREQALRSASVKEFMIDLANLGGEENEPRIKHGRNTDQNRKDQGRKAGDTIPYVFSVLPWFASYPCFIRVQSVAHFFLSSEILHGV